MSKLVWKQVFSNNTNSLKGWNIREGNDLLNDNNEPIMPGWGNGELQYYTGHAKNLYIDEHGLNLCAHKEEVYERGQTYSYTSARIDTKHKFNFCYGKLVFRAKLPAGEGLWPALWLMPQDSVYGTWPASGEIDVMEARGRVPNVVSGALHYGKDFEHKGIAEFSYHFENSNITEFHDYAIEWTKDKIRWLVDDHCYAERALDFEYMPFDQPFYIVMNLAVGGWYDRVDVDASKLPAVMTISHIALYEL